MDYFVPKYRRNPNEKVESIYSGIAPGNQTVTTVVKPSMDGNHMEATKVYGPGPVSYTHLTLPTIYSV